MYFEGCTGASVGAGDEGSGVGESEEGIDDEGESSRERLGIACANVAERMLLWLCLAPYAIPSNATWFPQWSFKRSQSVHSVLESGNLQAAVVAGDCAFGRAGSDIKHGLKD